MGTLTEMKKGILDFMDKAYLEVVSVYNPRGYRNRHMDCEMLYAYLSGRFPDEPMKKCFDAVSAIQKFCAREKSVYPYPDGEYWTAEEVEKYISWRSEKK